LLLNYRNDLQLDLKDMKLAYLALPLFVIISISSAYASSDSCGCVAFRLDDVQDYWLDDVQIKVMDTFMQNNASLTIGIIGNYFGHDSKLVNHVKSIVDSNTDVEIANHGWNHEDFTKFSRTEQSSLMKLTNDKMAMIFGLTPDVFIPPYEMINNDTMIAFYENKFRYISSNVTMDKPIHVTKNNVSPHIPSTAYTGLLNADDTLWLGENHKQTLVRIIESIQKYGYAVVEMHPQEYSIRQGLNYSNIYNETQIHELKLLIDDLHNDNIKFVNMSNIQKDIGTQTFPAWTEKIQSWYDDYTISASDVYNTYQFLIQNQIIKFNFPQNLSKYPTHQNITTTVFWIGESADADNDYISNSQSAWDSMWIQHYGGIDDPKSRAGFFPSNFVPRENPFYVALPYNDIDGNGIRKSDSTRTYWYDEKNWNDSESIVKNRWVKITRGDKTAYAQWEDAGPFVYDDVNYVFGNNPPKAKSGLDISPAVRDYIEIRGGKSTHVSWQFVDEKDVPDGPWKMIITRSQISN